MKHQNITFSIPEDLKIELQAHVRKGRMSLFISEAIAKALRKNEFKMEKELDAAYEAANLDTDRMDVLKDWSAVDDVNDLIDDEDWTWLKDKTEETKYD